MAPWLVGLGLRRPPVYAGPVPDVSPREAILASCRALMPGGFAVFSAEMATEAFGEMPEIQLILAFGTDMRDLRVSTDRAGNITVRRPKTT